MKPNLDSTVLFIGGPVDGKWGAIPPEETKTLVPVFDSQGKREDHVYEAMMIAAGDRIYRIFRPALLSDRAVLELLLGNYHPR
jgi:hypothetical protein